MNGLRRWRFDATLYLVKGDFMGRTLARRPSNIAVTMHVRRHDAWYFTDGGQACGSSSFSSKAITLAITAPWYPPPPPLLWGKRLNSPTLNIQPHLCLPRAIIQQECFHFIMTPSSKVHDVFCCEVRFERYGFSLCVINIKGGIIPGPHTRIDEREMKWRVWIMGKGFWSYVWYGVCYNKYCFRPLCQFGHAAPLLEVFVLYFFVQ